MAHLPILAIMPEELITAVLQRALVACLCTWTDGASITAIPTAPYCIGVKPYVRKVGVVSTMTIPRLKPTKGLRCLQSRLNIKELEAYEWRVFADLAGTQASIATYFDYYSYERLHSIIGYQLPYFAYQKLV